MKFNIILLLSLAILGTIGESKSVIIQSKKWYSAIYCDQFLSAIFSNAIATV